MTRRLPLICVLLLLSGCETLNDSVVRLWFQDRELGHRVHDQISEGLKRRMKAPMTAPKTPAPSFLDQG